jgi:formate dehydrogenase subunit beta
MSDIAMGNWGVIGPLAGKATFVEVFSDKGADILQKAIDAGALKVQDPVPKGIEIRANIDKAMVNLANKWQAKDFGEEGGLLDIDAYMDEFDRCIKCYGCREACPICWCIKCTIESESDDWVGKGEIPPSPMFHFVRMIHMVDSCTNCGQCEEVCPAEIPLAKIWHEINSKMKEVYGYERGVKEGMPPFSYFPLEAGK